SLEVGVPLIIGVFGDNLTDDSTKGGCCPSNFACARNECIPPSGYSITSNKCATGSRLCGAEYGYGCCKNDLDCGVSTCYPRTTSSFVATLTIITTDHAAQPKTEVTVVTTAYLHDTSKSTLTSSDPIAVPKASASTTSAPIPKQTSSPAPSAPVNNGLSKAVIGGLVGGVAVCLIAVLIAAFYIYRKLHNAPRTRRLSQSTRGKHSSVGGTLMMQKRHKLRGNSTDSTGHSQPTGYHAVADHDFSRSGPIYPPSLEPPAEGYPRDQNLWHGRELSSDRPSQYRMVMPPPHHRTLSDDSVISESSGYGSPDEFRRPRGSTLGSHVSYELADTDRRKAEPPQRQSSFRKVFGSLTRPSPARRTSSGDELGRMLRSQPGLEAVAEGNGSRDFVEPGHEASTR
ncbi:MAG: hypothetical protein M1835_000799, partial [Candelina submexicana]